MFSQSFSPDRYDPNVINKRIAENNLRSLNQELWSDFTFIVKGTEIKVHKAILAAASRVFDKLFTIEMEESRNNVCKVDHIEPSVFLQLLRFIYGGNLSGIKDVPKQLYEAAHYYGIEELEKISKEEVLAQLSTANALETFKWAQIYNLEVLKLKAWTIVKSDILKITKTLKYEPLSVEDIEEIIAFRAREDELWKKYVVHVKPGASAHSLFYNFETE